MLWRTIGEFFTALLLCNGFPQVKYCSGLSEIFQGFATLYVGS